MKAIKRPAPQLPPPPDGPAANLKPAPRPRPKVVLP